MTSNTLYVYQLIKPNGKKKITKSLTQRTDKGELIGTEYRLIADTGKVLTDGRTVTNCIDTQTPELWSEIDEPTPEVPETVIINEENQN